MAPRYDPDWGPDPLAAPWEPGEGKAVGPREPKDKISITHDLDDDELGRFLGFDAFYDPLPWFGLIPQWVVIVVLCGMVGLLLGLGKPPRDAVILSLVGALGLPIAMLLLLVYVCAARRRRVQSIGLCQGRIVTISRRGLNVRIPGASYALLTGHEPGIPWIGPLMRPWSAIRRISNDGRDLTFWLKQKGLDLEGRARVRIPLRAFDSPAEAGAFEGAARSWHAIASGEDAHWWEDDPS